MSLFERIKELATKRGKNLKEVALELGLSENIFYTWKKSSPKSEVLEKVADYFDVSTDYLLGREVENEITETDLEKMIDNAMSFSGKPMSENDREVIMAFLKGKFGV
ncbi:helix-turn-helix transcriptional regulator [uncultured Vagococcus sp.]|uniref:helix-turn-helix domain-containing protein n=1 Tax=uncultured Vagococcus sp. TaxID=189676 RepID=UPI0028D826D9|nr:helix-turn-helix transcriptional regulator [uncultured Vagococcus sp.]